MMTNRHAVADNVFSLTNEKKLVAVPNSLDAHFWSLKKWTVAIINYTIISVKSNKLCDFVSSDLVNLLHMGVAKLLLHFCIYQKLYIGL